MPRVYPSARDRILDAAERLILSRGVGQLSVEAVAAEAKVSKGGFFHHFATKDEMLVALIERLTARLNQETEAIAAKDPEPRGARLRAQIALAFDMDKASLDRLFALALALIEVASTMPQVVRHTRRMHAQILARDAAEDIPIGRAALLQFALDGYALSQALGSISLSKGQKAALKDSMMALARPEGSAKRAARKGKQP